MTSSYYASALPDFVQKFNNSGIIKELNNRTWTTTHPIESYTTSRADNNPYERNIKEEGGPVFPYDLSTMNANGSSYYRMLTTPFANEMIGRLAEKAIKSERLGKRGETDFLAVNFSSTDYAGHGFGPYSIEVADMYVKLDETIAQLLKALDKQVGSDNYVIALTSDHGAVPAPKYLMESKLPGKPFSGAAIKSRLAQYVSQEIGIDSLIEASDGFQIYLNHSKIPTRKYNQVVQTIKSFLLKEEAIHSVYTKDVLESYGAKSNHIIRLLQNGFYAKRSGRHFLYNQTRMARCPRKLQCYRTWYAVLL